MKERVFLKENLKIGFLTLIKRAEDFDGLSDSRPQWLCRCDCGNTITKVNRDIKRAPHCGCKTQKVL